MTIQYAFPAIKMGDTYSAINIVADPVLFPDGSVARAQIREKQTVSLAIEVPCSYLHGVLTIGAIPGSDTATLSPDLTYVLEAQLTNGTLTKTQASGLIFVYRDYCFAEPSVSGFTADSTTITSDSNTITADSA